MLYLPGINKFTTSFSLILFEPTLPGFNPHAHLVSITGPWHTAVHFLSMQSMHRPTAAGHGHVRHR
jgi:hypothetical protein